MTARPARLCQPGWVPVPWVHAFVDAPTDRVGAARTFWSAVAGWPPGEPWPHHPEFVSLLPPWGAPYLHVQRIGGPPRVHLDLLGSPADDVPRLAGLGAEPGPMGDGWQVLTSPAGLPFCVCEEAWPHERPVAVAWPDGHRSRLVQLCVDVPADRHDAELDFWRSATGWADEPVDSPEFSRLAHRSESPMALLIQRLGDGDGGTHARAHLDLGTDDVDAEVARVRALGAELLWPGDGFVALRDPVGLPFCVTANQPDRGT
ncbi:VOC family protein [Modestobacter sp. URMC 112]